MVSSCDRRIGGVPVASAMDPRTSGWIGNYRFGCTASATNVGNQYQSRQPARKLRPTRYQPWVVRLEAHRQPLECPMMLLLDRVEFRSLSGERGRWVCLPLAKN